MSEVSICTYIPMLCCVFNASSKPQNIDFAISSSVHNSNGKILLFNDNKQWSMQNKLGIIDTISIDIVKYKPN